MTGDALRAPFDGLASPARRPRVVANAAASLDGRIARRDGTRLVLSDSADLSRVHRLRAETDAILIGVGTVLADDPSLLVRHELVAAGGAQLGPPGEARRAGGSATSDPSGPLRVVLDTDLRTPPGARVLAGDAPTLLYCREGAGNPSLDRDGVSVVEVPEGRGGVHLPSVLEDLARRGVERLMVEGGSRVLTSFLTEGLADRFLLYVSPVLVGEGAPGLVAREASVGIAAALRLVASQPLGEGVLLALEPS